MTAHASEFSRFGAWLSRQAGRPDAIGALASDLRVASGCKTLVSFRQWLRWYGAVGAVQTLELALCEYRQAMRQPPEPEAA